jgi:hypothetical protein
MIEGQPWNVAIAEIEHNGSLATITGAAATENDDAIELILSVMEQENIAAVQVVRLYSEREPSEDWKTYIEQHWPRAQITWGVNRGEDEQLDSFVEVMFAPPSKPWWKFW